MDQKVNQTAVPQVNHTEQKMPESDSKTPEYMTVSQEDKGELQSHNSKGNSIYALETLETQSERMGGSSKASSSVFYLHEGLDYSTDKLCRMLPIEKSFHDAARRDDVESMTKLLEAHVNIDAGNNLNRTALHFATAAKKQNAVEFLLNNKARTDIADAYGMTALHLAAWSGDMEIMKILINAGAARDAKNKDEMNVLHFAACNNHVEVASYLIDDLSMKNLNEPNERWKKPFHLAVENGCFEMVRALCDWQLSCDEKDKEGNTPIHLAAKNNHSEVLKLLLEVYENVDEINEAGETPFFIAVAEGHQECAEMLLAAGSDVNILTKNKTGALHVAAQKGQLPLVQLLIKHNVNLEIPNEVSPLHIAVRYKQNKVACALLEAGCNINILDNRNQTPLHLAADLGNAEIVEILLKEGANLKIQDKQSKTPLGVAARSGETNIVDMIIKAERYNALKEEKIASNEMQVACPQSFKQDHSAATKTLRSIFWNLAHNQLKPNEWKKLAQYWKFADGHIKIIEQQWTGPKSYREHGHRMLLIWWHSTQLKGENVIKLLYEGLVHIGCLNIAEKIRAESSKDTDSKKCTIS
ncbi:ankyrin repeat and death domain-containing protein 1B isoform X1 [Protopterus annectens]|uniref:ankyrin repeat and death domain-containing protein 1B isoform X1 n=1 Tax=Protopterus annectens TaxID=7888 RepID=UPI001CF9C7B6|nr:ankyrin repeat and death domain-containing protein 1B isoform X1 [Protopterus annectens]